MGYLPHEYLPPPFDGYLSKVLLADVPNADRLLLATIGFLLALSIFQLRFFARPPPVPLKKLPRRPALSILFKPDDISSEQSTAEPQTVPSTASNMAGWAASAFLNSNSSVELNGLDPVVETVKEVFLNIPMAEPLSPGHRRRSTSGSMGTAVTEEETKTEGPMGSFDLPDSFAPLLSSSQTEVLLDHLTADLIHGIHLEAMARMQSGRHEIPLDKDPKRPQFTVDIPSSGVKLSALASVGSDGFSSKQDLDVTIPTGARSRPMVKNAGITFEPPMPLINVAPTLIHIPTLFEDNNVVPRLRRIQAIRYLIDAMVAVSSTIEKVLWAFESYLQIHLGKVQITPLYKGRTSEDDVTTPEWRLSLAFSGHVLLFGWIPIPFINVILPTFIIPQPHALLEYLISKQPLATARIRRENIAEERIALALVEAVGSWTSKVVLVATPPAVGIDLTLSGGVSLGLELLHGRDPIAGRHRQDPVESDVGMQRSPSMGTFAGSLEGFPINSPRGVPPHSGGSLSSWSTNDQLSNSELRRRATLRSNVQPYDANTLVPWKLELSAKGSVHNDRMTFHLLDCSFHHDNATSSMPTQSSQLKTRGSFAVWKAHAAQSQTGTPSKLRRTASYHRAALAGAVETPSVAAILLFPDEAESLHHEFRMLEYDYAFEISEDSKVDAVTFSVGANHPMLNGGSVVTTILESIYARGSVTARQHAVVDPRERRRKRNILRHLPAIDMTFGIQNSFIPPESCSYTDDGQTRSLPEMEGGRIMIRLLGGIQEDKTSMTETTMSGLSQDENYAEQNEAAVSEGIKLVADFGFSSIVLNSETMVKEFPELDVFEGTKLRALTSAKVGGSIHAHLRPQNILPSFSPTGPNTFNPLEAYEIDCSRSSFTMKIKECMTSLGHRRVIIPAETMVKVKVVDSVVDMSMDGRSSCELSWDFQGLSPILQVTDIGLNPESVMHEKKEQVSLLIAPLRQGRLNFHVSPVGGINITKAATVREDKEGLYDWKFFNALVSPEESASRLVDVVHDKRTMKKLLQVIKLINKDAHRVANYVINQVWRLKEIFDKEGVSDPKHIIPGHRMARLVSLLLCDDLSQANVVLPVIKRVVEGDGLDVVTVKELIRSHCDFYEEWTPEIDRAVRWLETMFSPISVPPQFVENNVTPLAQLETYFSRFRGIPSAKELYEQIHDRPHLPLGRRFSNLLARLAPYLSFHQIEYFLKVRSQKDWQEADLKRLRYVYSIKKKVLDIAESYGGLSFLPQSFLVSVFLGEATRASMRVTQPSVSKQTSGGRRLGVSYSNKPSILASLRQRRSTVRDPTLESVVEDVNPSFPLSAAGRVASLKDAPQGGNRSSSSYRSSTSPFNLKSDQYELADCLLGPADVAALLQAGLTSVMKGSSVVQLNQRMLLDLVASQPRSFAVAVLAEIGTPGGQGSPRQLTSALLALLELDQSSFRPIHRLNMHALLESWLPGLKVAKREDYMAGGRWARQSYYDAIFSLANNILEDAECYMALKSHVQRFRHNVESDPLPEPKEKEPTGLDDTDEEHVQKITDAVALARSAISNADRRGREILQTLVSGNKGYKNTNGYKDTVAMYHKAFEACARVRDMDKLSFQADWFRDFYRRNYDALMIKSVYDNIIQDVDAVRYWMHCLRRGARFGAPRRDDSKLVGNDEAKPMNFFETLISPLKLDNNDHEGMFGADKIFLEPEKHSEQRLVEAIIEAIIYDKEDRERLKSDPLVRLLIPNPPGHYDFTVVTAMGVITEGKKGKELQDAMDRLENLRGVKTIRADTATVRSFEYNAGKIIEAIQAARELGKPFGLVGYSQGCANALMAETLLYSGTPVQQQEISDSHGLVSRQLLFSAANASIHGPAMDKKVQRLIVQVEDFFKYQQGYFSRALQSAFLESLTSGLDSPQFHKMMGGAQSFLSDGCRAFWRESQHLAHVPTCTIRGVLEEHTTPEALEMLSNQLTKQSGSGLHDSQVHVYDAVGHPVYHHNRNGRILEKCDIGRSCIQRTHHWSPLEEEVDFIATPRDAQMASFACAKDRHLFPWVEVNARFGFIKHSKTNNN